MGYLVDVDDQAAVPGSGRFHQRDGVRDIIDHGAAHNLKTDGGAILLRLLA